MTLALVTMSHLPLVHAVLDTLPPDRFADVVSGDQVTHGKPHPEPYLMGLQRAGVEAAEAVVVENAPLGVEAAHAAGIFTYAINTGPLPDSVLWQAGADCVVPKDGGFEAVLQDVRPEPALRRVCGQRRERHAQIAGRDHAELRA